MSGTMHQPIEPHWPGLQLFLDLWEIDNINRKKNSKSRNRQCKYWVIQMANKHMFKLSSKILNIKLKWDIVVHLSNWQWWKIKKKLKKGIIPRLHGLLHTTQPLWVKRPAIFLEGHSANYNWSYLSLHIVPAIALAGVGTLIKGCQMFKANLSTDTVIVLNRGTFP